MTTKAGNETANWKIKFTRNQEQSTHFQVFLCITYKLRFNPIILPKNLFQTASSSFEMTANNFVSVIQQLSANKKEVKHLRERRHC